ncbi:RNA-binding E3 ubiquitin-protein ligase MEX3C [Pyrus ussuriensis x Pyrus communis]|uniref:RNA-binding E3 ubiquitin-protein ligase MEX3C n=1 Tax=Pyrus ussuriensis x Pyrus communis TaxID=2448454 RepID=A0A5N5F6D2_9ROSA|nr:RNA-binding E3 ubiquitin-protein ligase MEX3C [Pyrus ussuriensis x Pyrus communis]
MVEEQMRDCFIKNKRPKRRLSPSAAALAEERRLNGDGFLGSVKGFDPQGSKERALELVYQFHG